MISLEKAKALKEANLSFDNTYLEWDFENNQPTIVRLAQRRDRWVEPSLSQLLALIEAAGWAILLNITRGKSKIAISKWREFEYQTDADTPEDAAASAYLHILRQKRVGK